MTRTVSVGAQIKHLSGLLGTSDLTDWEFNFMTDVYDKTQGGSITGTLSELQCKTIERIFLKHFA